MSHKDLGNMTSLYKNELISSHIKEITEMATCLFFLERYKSTEELIKLEFFTKDKERWENVREIISRIFEFQTHGEIEINFISVQRSAESYPIESLDVIDGNILLSGGADSIAGAYSILNNWDKKIVCSNTYHHNTPTKKNLREISEEMNLDIFMAVEEFKNIRSLTQEYSTNMFLSQLRTLVYILNAIPVNYAFNAKEIYVAEQGPFIINPPFSPNFKFTDTTNPYFIRLINQFLNDYIPEFKITVHLPLRDYTKAEIMRSIPENLLIRTHSCSRHPNWKKSCGDCYSCMVRRFSAYASKLEIDDSINIEGIVTQRYSEANKLLAREINSYKENEYFRLLIDLIDFCEDIIKNRPDLSFQYNSVKRKLKEIGHLTNLIEDPWDLLKRFALDIYTGIYNIYERNPRLKKYYFWNKFDEKLSSIDFDLIDNRMDEIIEIGRNLIPKL
ncbi:MAG: 7-cyano-7-deazaguanine synthase [Candidatus Helarchaeota archaeon]